MRLLVVWLAVMVVPGLGERSLVAGEKDLPSKGAGLLPAPPAVLPAHHAREQRVMGAPAPVPQTPAAPQSELPVYIGTTGFAWGGRYAGAPGGASRSGWGLEPHAFSFYPGGFLFSHGPAGNFFLLGGARNFYSRTHLLSGFGIRRGFVLRRRR